MGIEICPVSGSGQLRLTDGHHLGRVPGYGKEMRKHGVVSTQPLQGPDVKIKSFA